MRRSSCWAPCSRGGSGGIRSAHQVPDSWRTGSALARRGRDQALAGRVELHQAPAAADEAEIGGKPVLAARLGNAAEVLQRPAEVVARAAALRLERNGAQQVGHRALVFLEMHVDR